VGARTAPSRNASAQLRSPKSLASSGFFASKLRARCGGVYWYAKVDIIYEKINFCPEIFGILVIITNMQDNLIKFMGMFKSVWVR
jgi:hypothetical protein